MVAVYGSLLQSFATSITTCSLGVLVPVAESDSFLEAFLKEQSPKSGSVQL